MSCIKSLLPIFVPRYSQNLSSVTVTSIFRVTSVQNSLKNKGDLTYNFVQRGTWSLLEANLGTISSCLPVLKQPLGRLCPGLFGATTKKDSAYYFDDPRAPRGYNLSNVSGQSSNPEMWRGPVGNGQTVAVSGPERPNAERKSDERHILITEFMRGSERNRDIDVECPAQRLGGISKSVEFVQTSFHEDSLT